MTLTAKVKAELAEVHTSRSSARNAEAAALIRFAGTVENTSFNESIIEVEADTLSTLTRLDATLRDHFTVETSITSFTPGGTGKVGRHVLKVSSGGSEVIRRLGLITRGGHPVVGLPPQVISGGIVDAEAAWRGAFLASGVLMEPGRSATLEVEAPCTEAALALVGCARRLGLSARTKEHRGTDRVVVRDGDDIRALLTRMGAPVVGLEWDELRQKREAQMSTNRLANFDDANLRRSARAAVQAAARVERAMEILGDDVPDHLAEAGQLRITHRQASLEELGRLADPQMTKDAVAGRIRRLLSMADKRAEDLDIPDTHSVVVDEIFDQEQ